MCFNLGLNPGYVNHPKCNQGLFRFTCPATTMLLLSVVNCIEATDLKSAPSKEELLPTDTQGVDEDILLVSRTEKAHYFLETKLFFVFEDTSRNAR